MHCGHCGAEGRQRCGHCKNIHYCSQECQQADWRFHKLLCKQLVDFQERPSEDVRRAIFFPEKGDKPEFMWLPVVTEDTEECMLEGNDDVDEKTVRPVGGVIFGPGSGMPSWSGLVRGGETTGKLLDHSLYLAHHDNFMSCSPNRCIARMLGEKVANRWRGPLMLCARNISFDPTLTLDTDTSGLTLALDSLVEYTRTLSQGTPFVYRPTPMKKSPGLKINAIAPFYREVALPPRHPVFKSGIEAPVTKDLFECPLRVFEYAGGATDQASNATTTSQSDGSASNIADLFISVDPSDPGFGAVPPPFWKAGASLLIVGTNCDGNKSRFIVEAFCDFVKKEIQPLLTEDTGTPQERLVEARRRVEPILSMAKYGVMMD